MVVIHSLFDSLRRAQWSRRINILPRTHFGSPNLWVPNFSVQSKTYISNHGLFSSSLYEENLKSRILKLKSPTQSVKSLLQEWFDRGRRKVHFPELKRVSVLLIKSQRYNQALEVVDWMGAQDGHRMLPSDHAIRLYLIIKVHGLSEAENYFMSISNTASQKAAFVPLLHAYVKERDTENAEALMISLHSWGLLVNCHPYNEMMKLYMATSQYNKVHDVILQMKQNKIPRNFLSYNIWMNACSEMSGVASAEMAYEEMVKDENVRVGWSTLATLANIYLKVGLAEKATMTLGYAEKRLSTSKRLGYNFLIMLYTSLKNKEAVLRLWEASKDVDGRITAADYKGIISCLIKLGNLAEAERIFLEWESKCWTYDIRVSNVLLGAYTRNGFTDKAESLHFRTLEKGGYPNSKTWEILMEGWMKSLNMDKAINAMKKWLSTIKDCDRKPSQDSIMAVAEYLEKSGNFDDTEWYIREIHKLGLSSLGLYKVFIRMHLHAQRPASGILFMMEKDELDMDDETSALLHDLKKFEKYR